MTPRENLLHLFRREGDTCAPVAPTCCTPTHLVEPEVPWENMEAYLAACRDFTAVLS